MKMNMFGRGQRTQIRTCERKFRYDNQYFADVEVASLKAEGLARAPERLHSYLCPYCDGWHVGHVREGRKAYAFDG